MDDNSTCLFSELNAIAVLLPLGTGEILFQNGDRGEGAYVVLTGHVALSWFDSGNVYSMDTRGPQSILGLPAVFNGSYCLSAYALEDSTIGFIPVDWVLNLLSCHPRLRSEAIKIVAQEIARVRRMIAGAGDLRHYSGIH